MWIKHKYQLKSQMQLKIRQNVMKETIFCVYQYTVAHSHEATISCLQWGYHHLSMPWNLPKS